MLVGAGGHFCPIARELNPGTRTRPVVAAVEMEVELTNAQLAQCRVPGDTPLLDFCDDFSGYGWCFRKGRFVNVGIGRINSRELPRHAESFLQRLISDRVLPADLEARLKGHAYLLSTRSSRVNAADGVLLAGDAAGLADVHSGEGIRPAIESGLMAAEAIVNGDLSGYEQALVDRFAPAAASEKAAALVPGVVARSLARRLMQSSFFVRRVVLDRWFLGRDRPPLRPALSGGLYESC
jgi:flavin-dependent dehydrogenase